MNICSLQPINRYRTTLEIQQIEQNSISSIRTSNRYITYIKCMSHKLLPISTSNLPTLQIKSNPQIPQDPCMLYMVTFTVNIPPMLAYIPYMDPSLDVKMGPQISQVSGVPLPLDGLGTSIYRGGRKAGIRWVFFDRWVQRCQRGKIQAPKFLF